MFKLDKLFLIIILPIMNKTKYVLNSAFSYLFNFNLCFKCSFMLRFQIKKKKTISIIFKIS